MRQREELLRENEALRERLCRLSEASLNITEDLDLDVVLQGVADQARLLTGAGRGCITVVNDTGRLQEFISSGVSEEDHQRCLALAKGPEYFAYLSSLPDPLRVADFSALSVALGLPEIGPPLGPVGSFISVPIRCRGVQVGNCYLSDKPGGAEFTQEDEDTLVMFSSYAAMAITNARRHHQERRARADLETLIDTSPVGVVVFDVLTGEIVSINREARRIVDRLRDPDQTREALLEVVTCQRADGREVSLREYPLAHVLGWGETVRAEEMTLGVPDGRQVTALVNATPILSDEGAVESMVVTLQDMASVEESERLRAEFLAMVSHELRTPLTSIKGSVATVLGSAVELDPGVIRQFFRIIDDQVDHMQDLVSDLLDVARIETGTLAVSPEPAEPGMLVDRARRAFTSMGGRSPLAIDIDTDLPLVMADRRRIVQVLSNLLHNADRHSTESAVIRVTAIGEGVNVAVSVIDEGRGIPAESLPLLFQKFSRVETGDLSGDTGLGLAICKGIVEAHGGRIWAESDGSGLGARFTFTLPTVEDASSTTMGRFPPDSGPPRQQTQEPARILAVDDDPHILRYIRDTLAQSGYAPIVTGEPEEALRLVAEERPQLVLLDLMFPETDGTELMEEILAVADLPVIFLSAYGRDELIAKAFDMGAADYVVKPFSPTELSARIRAALRRRSASQPLSPYVRGDLTIDYNEHTVTLAGQPVRLAAMEYRMLSELSVHGGRVLTYDHLLHRVWGDIKGGDIRPMRTIVSKLRRKLGDQADHPKYLFTEPRIGYRMPKKRNTNRIASGKPRHQRRARRA